MAKKPRGKTATRSASRSSGSGRRASTPPLETAHARRIRRYLEKHPGATKREARGHRPEEHATRAKRAKAEKRLTEGERAAIRRYTRQRAKDGDVDADELYAATVQWAREKGFKVFDRLKATRERLRKAGASGVRMRVRKGVAEMIGDTRKQQRNVKIMEDFAEAHDLPDSVLLYYH